MATKDLQYRLTADERPMVRGFKSAEASARVFERELAKLEARERRIHSAMSELGTGMLVAGGAIAAGLGLAVKAAIDWESAWTGVAKVVDGSPQQMAALEAELRALTRVLPQTHEEIAGVAAAAGQLGIAREDIAEFTTVMVNLGVATNLTSEQAAFALARMMNIMQTSTKDVDRLGSAITQLGNTSATTEAEIVEMALRIAGAGHTIGLSEAEVLAFSAALSSVGIAAEAGGSAISRAFVEIDKMVRVGKEDLTTLASVAGMSADRFRQAYQQDAAGAIRTFVEGLGRIQRTGGDVFATLERLGFTEIRLRDALLRLAGAGDLLDRSLENANRGWDENAALIAEAERRYETVEARLQLARNAINDLGIDIGQTLLPAVGEAADLAGGFADVIGELPGPVKAALTVLAALAAALLLAGGTALLLVPRIAAAKAAIDTLANSSSRLATVTVGMTRALGSVGNFLAGPWGIAIGFAITALTAFGVAQASAKTDVDDLIDTLDEQTGAVTGASRAWIAHRLEEEGALAAAQALGLELSGLVDVITEGGDAAAYVAQRMREMGADVEMADEALIMYNGDAFTVAEALAMLQDRLSEAQSEWARTTEAVHGNTDAMSRLDPETRRMAEAFGITADAAKELAGELDTTEKEFKALFDRVFGLQNAQDDLADAVDRLRDGIKRQREEGDKNAGSFEGQSKAARENRDRLQEVLEAQSKVVLETIKHTGSNKDAQAAADNFTSSMEALAEELGINIENVEGYNEVVSEIERYVQTRIDADIKQALGNLRTYTQWLDSIPETVRTRVIAETRRVGGGPREFAHGGEVGGGGVVTGPFGIDRVPIMATRGEFVSTVDATMRNRAALEAANAGARLAVVGSPRLGGVDTPASTTYTYNIYPATAQFGVRDLELLIAQQEATQRAGRAR